MSRSPVVRRGVLVDSNLLLLLFIGKTERALIPRFKRTHRYSVGDFDSLCAFVDRSLPLVTTPNGLTEVSNLAGALNGELLANFRVVFADIVGARSSAEKYRQSRLVAATQPFHIAGLADAAMIEIARADGHLLLTDDRRLAELAAAKGVAVARLDEIRAARHYYQRGGA